MSKVTMSNPRGVLRIGTSGIVVPGSKASFPADFQDKSRLNYYASLFNTLEVNSTFKKLPLVSTLEKWTQDVSEDFQFTLKLWKEITHVKQLHIDVNNINVFMKTATHIGNKKGCLLVQFPASITADYNRELEQILQRLQEVDYQVDYQNEWRKAIELRSDTWYKDETYELINKYHGSLVLHDMPSSKNLQFDKSSEFIYLRFHGPTGNYRGDYSIQFLEQQANSIEQSLSSGKDVYAYFNNTMGNAFENAMSLKALVEHFKVN